MAQGKKSFIAYSDWKDVFDELPNEDAGALIKHIFAYVNDENPTTDSVLIKAVFANIKTTLKRDLDKWESQVKQRVEAGKKSAEQRMLNKLDERERNPTSVEIRQRNPTVSDNVSVSDIIDNKLSIIDCEKITNALNNSFRKDFKKMTRFEKQLFEDKLNIGYTLDDFLTTIENLKNDTFAKGLNYRYITTEYICDLKTLQQYSKISTIEKDTYVSPDDKFAEYAKKKMEEIEFYRKQSENEQ